MNRSERSFYFTVGCDVGESRQMLLEKFKAAL